MASFDELGYIVVPDLFDQPTIDKFLAHFHDLCAGRAEAPVSMQKVRDVVLAKSGRQANSEESLTKIQDFQDDPVLFDYCKDPRMIPYVQQLIGSDLRSCHTMLINKPPDLGKGTSRHPLHQDLYYFPFRGPILTAWTAMEHIHQGNGCLIVVPGSHKGELLPHGYPDWDDNNAAYHGIQGLDMNEVKYVHLEMQRGDTVFFHPLLWHGSGKNKTSGYRKAISCHYCNSHCKFVDTANTVQDVIAKEVEGIAEKKLKKMGIEAELAFADIWRMRSRLIQGENGLEW